MCYVFHLNINKMLCVCCCCLCVYMRVNRWMCMCLCVEVRAQPWELFAYSGLRSHPRCFLRCSFSIWPRITECVTLIALWDIGILLFLLPSTEITGACNLVFVCQCWRSNSVLMLVWVCVYYLSYPLSSRSVNIKEKMKLGKFERYRL